MSKIAIVEVVAVRHFVAELCRIACAGNNEVVLFSTPHIYEQLQKELEALGIRIVLSTEGESLRHYLSRIAGEISGAGFEHCIINTYRAWQFLFFRPRTIKVVRKFNLNWMFRDTKLAGFLLGLANIEALRLSDPARNALTGPLVRRLMLNSVDAVLVEYPPFVDYIRAAWGPRPPVFFLPLTAFEGNASDVVENAGQAICFAVPGIVTELRRDYSTVLDAFELLFDRYGSRVELILLGSADSETVVERCKQLASRGFAIKFFTDDFVPSEVYEGGLRRADMLIAPLKLEFRFREVRETYTISKGSGFFADSVRFGKPCIVPRACMLPAEFQDAFLRYEDGEELVMILSRLMENPDELSRMKKTALRLFEDLSLPKLGHSLNVALKSVRKPKSAVLGLGGWGAE